MANVKQLGSCVATRIAALVCAIVAYSAVAAADVITIPFAYNVTEAEGPLELYFGRTFQPGDLLTGRISYQDLAYKDIDPRPIQGFYAPLDSRIEFDVPSKLLLANSTLREARISVQDNGPNDDRIGFNAVAGPAGGAWLDFTWIDHTRQLLSGEELPRDFSFLSQFGRNSFGLIGSLDDRDIEPSGPHHLTLFATASAIAPTPEPGTLLLFGSGAIAAFAHCRRRAKAAEN
jgi:hypothetical protein